MQATIAGARVQRNMLEAVLLDQIDNDIRLVPLIGLLDLPVFGNEFGLPRDCFDLVG